MFGKCRFDRFLSSVAVKYYSKFVWETDFDMGVTLSCEVVLRSSLSDKCERKIGMSIWAFRPPRSGKHGVEISPRACFGEQSSPIPDALACVRGKKLAKHIDVTSEWCII